jgi:sec-independent protein translocase protein TatA
MHAPGFWSIMIIALVVLLLFGRGKISSLMGEVASGIKSFRRGMSEEEKPTAELQAPAASANAASTEKPKERDA